MKHMRLPIILEVLLIMLFIGCSIALSSLWPACIVTLSIVIKHSLTDFYNYKQTDAKLIESLELQSELDAMRLANINLSKSVNNVNENLNSLKTALTLGNRVK